MRKHRKFQVSVAMASKIGGPCSLLRLDEPAFKELELDKW